MAKNRVSFDRIYNAYLHCLNCKDKEDCDTWCEDLIRRFGWGAYDATELDKYRKLAPLHVVIGLVERDKALTEECADCYIACGTCSMTFPKKFDFTFCPDCGQRIKS